MWLCAQYHKQKCKSRIITFGKTVKITSKHNHPPVRPDLSNSVMQWFHIIRSTQFCRIKVGDFPHIRRQNLNAKQFWKQNNHLLFGLSGVKLSQTCDSIVCFICLFLTIDFFNILHTSVTLNLPKYRRSRILLFLYNVFFFDFPMLIISSNFKYTVLIYMVFIGCILQEMYIQFFTIVCK